LTFFDAIAFEQPSIHILVQVGHFGALGFDFLQDAQVTFLGGSFQAHHRSTFVDDH
jgi:hypothetical protein